MNLHRILLATLVLTAAIATVPSSAEAARARTQGGQVVHTRRLPVVLHRLVPPQYGKHVYVGRR